MVDQNKEDQFVTQVSVSNPKSHGKGRTQHMTYLVTTVYNKPAGNESIVRRRYSDFHWLQSQLIHERAGLIIPVIKHKLSNAKIKFTDEFVNERQEQLNRFLKQVVLVHPELGYAPCIKPFLTANAKDWEAAKSQAPEEGSVNSGQDQQTQSSKDSIVISAEAAPQIEKPGRFAQWKTKIRTKIALAYGDPKLEETPAENKKFSDLETYAEHLETCVTILSEDAVGYVEGYKAQSEKLKTMGAALTELWGEHKLSNASSSTMYQKLGDCWANLSKIMASQHETGLQKLDAPLQELILDVTALKLAIKQRKEVLFQYTAKVNEGRTKEVQIDKLRASNNLSDNQDRFFDLEKDVKILDAEIDILRTHVATVSKRLERDAERFRHGFHDKMRATMEAYHLSQCEYAEKNSKAWQDMVPALADGALDTTAASGPAKEADLLQLKVAVTTTGAYASFESVDMDNAGFEKAPMISPPSAAPPPLPSPTPEPPHSALLPYTLPPLDKPPVPPAEESPAPPTVKEANLLQLEVSTSTTGAHASFESVEMDNAGFEEAPMAPPSHTLPPSDEPPTPPAEESPAPLADEPPAPPPEEMPALPVPSLEEPPAPPQEVEEES
jgi:hypothetical protein